MPLFSQTPVMPTAPVINEEASTPIVDNASFYGNFQYNGNLIAYLEGTPWTCSKFYTQYVGSSNQPGNSGDVSSNAIKQYQTINNFELRLVEKLSSNVDQSTGTATVSGSANVYPVITPVIGDLFVALIEGGDYGLFEVKSVTRLTLYKGTAWKIDFTLKQYLTSNTYAEADTATISEFEFNVNALTTGSNPLSSSINVLSYTSVNALIQGLVDYYYQKFFNRRIDSFILSSDPNSALSLVYDPQLVKFWNLIVDHTYLDSKVQPKELDTANGFTNSIFTTVFDAMIQQSSFLLKAVTRYLKLMSNTAFSATYQRYGLFLQPIDYVVFAYGPDSPVEDANAPSATTLTNYMSLFFGDTGDTSAVIYPPVPYVFTLDFYNETSNVTDFEASVLKLIKRQAIPISEVTPYVDVILNSDAATQYYHIPILIALLKVAR